MHSWTKVLMGTRLLVITVRIWPKGNRCADHPKSFTMLSPRVQKVTHKSTSLIRAGGRVGGGWGRLESKFVQNNRRINSFEKMNIFPT